MLINVLRRIFFWAMASVAFACCIQAQLSSITNQANIGFPLSIPPVGTISRINLLGEREALSSIANAQVGLYHKDHVSLPRIPVPVPIPLQVPVLYLSYPFLSGPIRLPNSNPYTTQYKPRPLPVGSNAGYPAKPGSYPKPRPGGVTGRNSGLISNTNNLIGLEIGGLLGGLFQGGGSGPDGILGTGLLGGGGGGGLLGTGLLG